MNSATIDLVEAFVHAYPATAARRAEHADPKETAELLTMLEPETAVVLLSKLIPLAAAPTLAAMPPDEAARLAELLGPERVVPLLRRMEKVDAAAVIAELSTKTQTLVRRLLDYRTDQAASRMDPRAPAVSPQSTAEQAVKLVRQSPASSLYYTYVVDDQQRLIGVVSMRELMLAKPDTPIDTIMTRSPQRLRADDPIQSVLVHPGWRGNHALPVVDANDRFVGVVRYSAFRALEAELGQAQSGPAAGRTSEALAELLWLGTAAIGRMSQAAVLGSPPEKDST
jgi:magnesium transporter